jgi:hypothetical protein
MVSAAAAGDAMASHSREQHATVLIKCKKSLRSPFDALRVNGLTLELAVIIPFVLRLSKHENGVSLLVIGL